MKSPFCLSLSALFRGPLVAFVVCFSSFPALASEMTPDQLSHEVSQGLSKVDEFRFIKAEAEKQGLRVYLFGGTAAGFLHYVKWDLERKQGNPQYFEKRFDYDFTNIYRSTQDLDIVVDGDQAQIAALQGLLSRKFPFLMGSRSAWEVRSLRHPFGDIKSSGYKEALLNDFNFLNQNSDSNSTGLIEITTATDGRQIKDLRNWNNPNPIFLTDAISNKLSFYRSSKHFQTLRAQKGENPEIFSVIRYLTKAFQYRLSIPEADEAELREIIRNFQKSQVSGENTQRRFLDLGKKLFKHAVDLEYAWDKLEQLGLRQKLMGFDDPKTIESLAWWMNREPLRSSKVGQGFGRSAQELGIDIVAHETKSMLAFESITRSNAGIPNVFISREKFMLLGESAAFGDGFYTRIGKIGAIGSGLTIRFQVNPQARLGTDFDRHGDYLIFKNRNALRFIDETINLTPTEYFQTLASSKIPEGDRGIFEKFKRRLSTDFDSSQAQEVQRVVENTLEQNIHRPDIVQTILNEYLEIFKDSADLDFFFRILKKANLKIGASSGLLQRAKVEFRSLDHRKIEQLVLNIFTFHSNPLDVIKSNPEYSAWTRTLSPQQSIEFGSRLMQSTQDSSSLFVAAEIYLGLPRTPLTDNQFIKFCQQIGHQLRPLQEFQLSTLNAFEQMSEVDKKKKVIELFVSSYSDTKDQKPAADRFLIYLETGEILPEITSSENMTPVRNWLAQQNRVEFLKELLPRFEPFSGNRNYDDLLNLDTPANKNGSFLLYYFLKLAQTKSPTLVRLEPFVLRHLKALDQVKLAQIPALHEIHARTFPLNHASDPGDLKRFKVIILANFLTTLASLEETSFGRNRSFEDNLKTLLNFTQLGKIDAQSFNLIHHSEYEQWWSDGKRDGPFFMKEQDLLKDFQVQAAELLQNPELAEIVFNTMRELELAKNPKAKLMSSQEFFQALKDIQKEKVPRINRIREFYDRQFDRLGGTGRMYARITGYVFLAVAALNYGTKLVLMMAPPQLGVSTNYWESSMLFDGVFVSVMTANALIHWSTTGLVFFKLFYARILKRDVRNFSKSTQKMESLANLSRSSLRSSGRIRCESLHLDVIPQAQ